MANWTPLHIANANASTPKLLVSAEFSATGYTVLITDLSRLWSEELDRRQLIRRALNENTSIDPSEDASQLRIFLSKIQGALQGDDDTTLQVTPLREDDLLLHVDCALPPPLDHLQWRIELTLQPQELIRGKVTQPLVDRLGAMILQEEELLRQLHDKDNVIAKLLDKLESSGTDISDIFPGITGNKTTRKTISRAQAAQHVKGLGTFDQVQWLDQARVTHGSPAQGELMSRVFEHGSVLAKPSHPDEAAWGWQKGLSKTDTTVTIRAASHSAKSKAKTTTQHARQATAKSPQALEEDNSDFQRQSTPPSAQKQHSSRANETSVKLSPGISAEVPASHDSETESEDDDLDAPTSKKARNKTKAAAQDLDAHRTGSASPKRLGQIGSKQKPREDTRLGQEERREEREGSFPPHIDTEHPKTKAKIKSKLGKIGGNRSTRETTPEPALQEEGSGMPSPAKVHGRIGGGGKRTPTKKGVVVPVESQTKDSTDDMEIDRVEETQLHPRSVDAESPESSQDRADRKREELKRQLEAKAQAPAKKKRRF